MRPRSSLRALVLALAMAAIPMAANAAPDTEVAVTATPARVDLNHASVEALRTLPGIGRKKAEAIVALRDRRPFTRVTQLLQIKGIGHKTLLKLKPRITVTPPTKASAPLTAPTAPEPPMETASGR